MSFFGNEEDFPDVLKTPQLPLSDSPLMMHDGVNHGNIDFRVTSLEQRFDALESNVSQIRNMLEHNQNIAFSSSNASTSASSPAPAPAPPDQIFSMVDGKRTCHKCPLRGEARKEHLSAPSHLSAVRNEHGQPRYWCKGECGLTKNRGGNVNSVLLAPPTPGPAKLMSKLVADDHGNRWCSVCGGAFVLEEPAPSASSKKRKEVEGDVAMALRVSPDIARFTPGLYYVDDDLVLHSSLPLASKFVTPVISPTPQRVSGHPKHFDESRHTFGVTHLPVTESGLVDCFAILSRERYDAVGGTPASVLHALKQRELSLFGGRDDGFVTLRERAPSYESAWGPALQFPIDDDRFVVMSVHELRDNAERCLPLVADTPMPLGDSVADMFAALPQHWPPLQFDTDEADGPAPVAEQGEADGDGWVTLHPGFGAFHNFGAYSQQMCDSAVSPDAPPIVEVVKFQLLVLITSWEHVENPNSCFVACADDGIHVRGRFWCHSERRKLLIDAVRSRLVSGSTLQASAIARLLAMLCHNNDEAGIDNVLSMASDVLCDVQWLDWERALGEAVSRGHVGVALKLLAAFRPLQPRERLVNAVWTCAVMAIELDEFAQVEPWLVDIQWQSPFPTDDYRRAALVLAACEHGRVGALKTLLTCAHADEQWAILMVCDGPVPPPILAAVQRGRVDILSALCDMPALDFAGIVKSWQYTWFAASVAMVDWLFERGLMSRAYLTRAVTVAVGARDTALLVRLIAMCDGDLLRQEQEQNRDNVLTFVLQHVVNHKDEAVFRALVANASAFEFAAHASIVHVRLRQACLLFNEVVLFEGLPPYDVFEQSPNFHLLAQMMERGSLDAVDFAVHKFWKLDASIKLIESILTHPHPRLFESAARIESAAWPAVLCQVLASNAGSVPNRAALVDIILQKHAACFAAQSLALPVAQLLQRRQFAVADAVFRHIPDVVRLLHAMSVHKFDFEPICCCPAAIPIVQELGPQQLFRNQSKQMCGIVLADLVGEHLTPSILDALLETTSFFDPFMDPTFFIALIRHSPTFDAHIDRLLERGTKYLFLRHFGAACVRAAAKLGNQRLVDRLRAHPHCPRLPLIHEDDE